jgi:surface polysaccharide O-acyltransferase-like enzyme
VSSLDFPQTAAAKPRPGTRTRAETPAAARLDAIDCFRGLAMLAVVFIHATSATLSRLDPEGGQWFGLAVLNRSAQFAVPAFLFMTALLAARSSLSPRWNLGRYYLGRLSGVLVPYLLWSGLFGLFRVATGGLTLPELGDLLRWRDWLLTGNAYYHLYYLLVALQFFAIFPLFRPLLRLRVPFPVAFLLLAALQVGAYWLNRTYLRSPTPATLVISYLLPLGLGMWVGVRLDEWRSFWRVWRWPVSFLGLAGWVWYLPLAVQALRDVPVDTFQHASGRWLFTSTIILAMLALSHHLVAGRVAAGLRILGRYSLQVYLLHVMVIALATRIADAQGEPPLPTIAPLFVLSVCLPLLLAFVLDRTPISRFLFGGR